MPTPQTPRNVCPGLVALALVATLGTSSVLWGQHDDPLGPVDPAVLGVWEQVEPASEPRVRIEITDDFCARVEGEKLAYRSPVLGQREDGTLVVSLFCNRIDHRVEIDGDSLTLTLTHAKTKFRPEPETERVTYRRLAERPAELDLRPMDLGDGARPLGDERVAALRAELIERGERDQEIRRAFQKPDAVSEEIQEQMKAIDADNVAFLVELLAEVGWIDPGRFGSEASRAAWLIVQHSGDLALMSAVLPALETAVRESGAGGSNFALLWDRSRIWLGHKQRYGSQVFFGPEGAFIAPLEDPETVDQRRAELGLDPLDDYRAFFVERNDGKPLPIRTEF